MAYLIDIIPIVILTASVFYFFFDFDLTVDAYFNRGENIEPRKQFLKERNRIRDLSFCVWAVYCFFMDISSFQGTLGKKLLGLKVVNEKNERISLKRSFFRNFGKMFSYLFLLFSSYRIVFSKDKLGWHDKFSTTYVVNRN